MNKSILKSLCVLFLSFVSCAGIASVNSETTVKVLLKDFQKLTGYWEGTLTYLDYTSGKSFTMRADVEIKRIINKRTFQFSNIYPEESNANSADTVTISKNGDYINSEKIISRKKSKDGSIEIITEESGTDGNDNKNATFRFTYKISSATFSKMKEVKFEDSSEWILRHVYKYQRINQIK